MAKVVMIVFMTLAYPVSLITGFWFYIKSIVDHKDKKKKKDVL